MIGIDKKKFSEGFMHDLADLIDKGIEHGTNNIELFFDLNGKKLKIEMTFSLEKLRLEVPTMGEEIIKASIEQLNRISKKLGVLEESEDYTDVAISALEKQVPAQVKYVAGAFGEKYECPECGSSLTDTDLLAGHCKWCGQAIEDN